MANKVLIKGNLAIAQAAIDAGLECYFAYPITPQNEIGEFMSDKMPSLGKTYINAESELAAINMVIGACATGTKAMTSSSSCAIALMQEAISAMATAEIPGVIISVMRSGPGLGNITPSQGDYFQAVKGGGNGDYRTIVLAPSTIDEAVEYTHRIFHLAWKYRNPAMLLADGILGQMMEPVEFKHYDFEEISSKDWELDGVGEKENKRPPRKLVSLHMGGDDLIVLNGKLQKKYDEIEQNEVLYEEFMLDDAEIMITAFGTVARVAKSAIMTLREQGIKIGLFRPVTLWPFPKKQINKRAHQVKYILDVEMNEGQMAEDVLASINCEVEFDKLTKLGGQFVKASDIVKKVTEKALCLN
ncbi:TPA: 3-methyl-2-oxobutanoate dehydrogenase subunit VorB [Candidatus Galligastranaerophilus gallistercoris]|nr:3-methyl-2-oxobutanoate dehydrogenase subunit VorB [Candidatus Galligastranaerophilus gallistercoris]